MELEGRRRYATLGDLVYLTVGSDLRYYNY